MSQTLENVVGIADRDRSALSDILVLGLASYVPHRNKRPSLRVLDENIGHFLRPSQKSPVILNT